MSGRLFVHFTRAQDENRAFDDAAVDVKHMADLVRRDRNHASVIVWSKHLVASWFQLHVLPS